MIASETVWKLTWAAAFLGICVLIVASAHGQSGDPAQCPPGAKSCKVVTITPDEEQSLVGDNMIFAHAEWANRAGMSQIIAAWRNKLAGAPAGKLPEAPKK